MKSIYLDYNATTPVAEEVLDAMLPFLRENFGNPSSDHVFGNRTKKTITEAREKIADFLNCEPDEIVFTSGGSESNNHAIKGAALSKIETAKHIITSKIEHPSVLEVFSWLEKKGFDASYINVDQFGTINLEELEKAINGKTTLISIMHSNNEIGTIEPIEEVAQIAKKKNIIVHCDAAQSAGKIIVDFKKLGVDLISIAGHKIYAPKGIGVLVIKRGLKLDSFIHGAGHESGRRAGTENVPYIVALGKACEIAKRDLDKNLKHMRDRRDQLYNGLYNRIKGIELNGHPGKRLPNTVSLSFTGLNANTLLSELPDIAASPGAACHYENEEVSHVIKAIGFAKQRGFSTVRFSVGRETTKDQIDTAVDMIVKAAQKLKGEEILVHETGEKSDVKLTSYTHGLGCACKIKPKELEQILRKMPLPSDKNVLVGSDKSDDAAVYRISRDKAIVQTVDFFTPVVDDPFDFGKIAVANALSDIYAMGAKPLFALNIVAFPSKRLPLSVLEEILKGANDKAKEAGIDIIGGHTIEDNEPKFGLAVTGIVHPERIVTNSGAKPGDLLVLTKPLGTGILSTALKKGMLDYEQKRILIEVMEQLNEGASKAMLDNGANACTDITGFGLLGHALEMAKASNVDMMFRETFPSFHGVEEFVKMGIIPGGTKANLEYVSESVQWDNDVSDITKYLLCDAQTSGGLLISIPASRMEKLTLDLNKAGYLACQVMGKVISKGEGQIKVVKFFKN